MPPARSFRLQRTLNVGSISETAEVGRGVIDNLMSCRLSMKSLTTPHQLVDLNFFPASQTILFLMHLVELQLAWKRAVVSCHRATAAGSPRRQLQAGLPLGMLCQQGAPGHAVCCAHAASQHVSRGCFPS